MAAFIFMCGCSDDLLLDQRKDSSLQIVLKAPNYGIDLKSVSSDPNSPDKWTSWERVVDGRYIYRATAFILQGDRLVAHKDVELDGEAQEVMFNFEANFTHGSYTLMVVANYSPFEAEDGNNGTKKYDGLNNFTSVVEEILKSPSTEKFTENYGNSFLYYKLTSDNGVCKRVPQPLTLIKEIELHPGTNNISGELLRTYSRVRITVENNSDEDLFITSMNFSNIFTQSSAYLFENRGYLADKVAINAASSDAITPFTGSESTPITIASKGNSVIFDAYILESQRSSSSEKYSYSLGMGYDDLNSYTLKSTTAISAKKNVTTGYYLIYNKNGSRYLTAGANNVTAATLGTLKANMTISKEYVWAIDNSGLSSNQFYVGTADAMKNGQTAYYMNNPGSSSVTLGANKSVYFTIADKSSSLTFQSSGSGNYKYLSVNNGNVQGQRNNTSNNALFVLYPVDIPRASVVEIPVNTIDKSTGQSVEVNEICRNDFINAVVKVSYSKNQGHFNFEVKEWSSAGGDVEFN